MNLSSFFPTIVDYIPNIETEEVDSIPLIQVRFSVELDKSAINSDETLANYVVLTEEGTEQTVALTFVDYSKRILSFKPATALTEGNYYRVTILRGVPSFDGRTMQFNHTFTFKVTANDIPAPTLVFPGNNTAHTTNPTFIWAPISYETDQVLNYHIQVDSNTSFTTVAANGWETVSSACSGLPASALTQDTSYFWRVRAELVSGDITFYGDWSKVRTFYLGTTEQPSKSVRQTYAEAAPFHLSASSIDDGLSNQSSFPNLRFVFSSNIDASTVSAVTFTKESVDGYPSLEKTAVDFSTTITNSVLDISINETIVQNYKYTITFDTTLTNTNGDALPEKVSIYFTSKYSPLYVAPIVLRANFGAFLINYPDDLLNFYLYRTSIELNRYVLSADSNPTEDSLRTEVASVTAPMLRWVEHQTAAKLLTMRYYELLEDADSSRRLGDFQEQRGANILEELRAARKKEEQEALYWFSQFSLRRTKPISVVRSSRWNPQLKYDDMSSAHLNRDF